MSVVTFWSSSENPYDKEMTETWKLHVCVTVPKIRGITAVSIPICFLYTYPSWCSPGKGQKLTRESVLMGSTCWNLNAQRSERVPCQEPACGRPSYSDMWDLLWQKIRPLLFHSWWYWFCRDELTDSRALRMSQSPCSSLTHRPNPTHRCTLTIVCP